MDKVEKQIAKFIVAVTGLIFLAMSLINALGTFYNPKAFNFIETALYILLFIGAAITFASLNEVED